jgi:hypothetical protein
MRPKALETRSIIASPVGKAGRDLPMEKTLTDE